MVKNGAVKTSAIGLILVILVGLIVVFVPVSSEKIDVQCITAPCPPIIESKTIFDILTEQSEPEPVACILLFAPVCGVDGVTYDNTCLLENVGKTILAHEGQCTGDEGMIISDEPDVFCQIYPTASGCN